MEEETVALRGARVWRHHLILGDVNSNILSEIALSARRLQVLQHIIRALQKLAATKDIAILIFTQCGTRVQVDQGATLVPSVNAAVWDQGISTRLVLFRDWSSDEAESHGLHLVGVQKKSGTPTAWPMNDISAYEIGAVCLVIRTNSSSLTSTRTVWYPPTTMVPRVLERCRATRH